MRNLTVFAKGTTIKSRDARTISIVGTYIISLVFH